MKSVVILFSLFVLQYCNAVFTWGTVRRQCCLGALGVIAGGPLILAVTTQSAHSILYTEINADKHIDAFIQKLLSRGSALFDLPILDPYNNAGTITIGDLDIPDYISLHNVSLVYLHSTGLSRFVSHKLSVIQKAFEIDFDFNLGYTGLIVSAGAYNLNGVLTKSAEPLDGHGAIEIVLNDVTIKGNVTLGISPNSDFIFLQDMALNIDVSSDKIMMTGLNDGVWTGDVDLKPILPWVESHIVTLVSNIINEHTITSTDLLDCFYNCYI